MTAAILTFPAALFAEDPQTPGKTGTSTTNQTPKQEAPASPQLPSGTADKDAGKQSTTTTPSTGKVHPDAPATPAGGVSPSKAEGAAKADEKGNAGDKAKDAGEKSAGPVAGSSGSVGGSKASQ